MLTTLKAMIWLHETCEKYSVDKILAMRREGGKAVVGQAGLLALGPGVDAEELMRWIGEAREFAAEWGELRALHQNQLAGTPLRCPLQVRQRGDSTGCIVLPRETSNQNHPILFLEGQGITPLKGAI